MLPANTDRPLTIVVLFTHDGAQAKRCLDSIAAHVEDSLGAELVFVLNNCSDEVREAVAKANLSARTIETTVNVGTSVGWQLAFNAARGKRVLLMHEDAALTAGLAESLLEALDADPAAAIVAPWLAERGGSSPSNCGWVWFRDQSQTRLTEDHIPLELRDKPYAVDGVSSAISLWDRASWLEGGGFDERNFPALGVDADGCTSAWARGRSVLVDPRVLGVHSTGAMDSAPGRLSGKFVRYFMLDRYRRLWFEKWGAIGDWYAELPEGARPNALETPALLAVQARREARPRLAGAFPLAEHPFTDPHATGAAPEAVDQALAARLRAAELEAMDEYHFWLIAHSDRQHAEIEHLSETIRTMSAREADLIEDWRSRGDQLERLNNTVYRRARRRLRRLLAR